MFKSGFIAIIGEPNVGKSTLLNQLMQRKVAIVSDKPQTTRNVFSGIYNDEDSQMIFMDTPGIHKAKTKLGDYMTRSALNTIKAVDLVLFLVNAYDDVKDRNMAILQQLKGIETPVFLVANKIDAIKDFRRLKEALDPYKEQFDFKGVFGISALRGDNVNHLLEDIKAELSEGPQFYMDGEISDRPDTFLFQEFIREKILELTKEEVPHSVMVMIDQVKHKKKLTEIIASIIVERNSQKGIIIGKGGSMLKEIGTLARADIENLLGRQVFLELFVKVEADWRNREYYLKDYGYKAEKE
ncbi:MAG: GTPase Era [Candidatus Izemoplasmatales bacterium]|jgi:GTP-binding protein Era|nr:GTPase Era [Candidatus Izemoplasmatales bacterium]MDD3124090.1 GTPase Era [Candidatus Izemoplasmatales bacterium]